MSEIVNKFHTEIRRISHALQILFGFGRTSTQVNDSGVIRTVQAIFRAGQVKDNTPLVQHFGFASNPPVGADIVYAAINGDRSVAVIVGSNHQSFVIQNLGDGGTAIFDSHGNVITLTNSGGVKVHAATVYEWDVNGYGQRITWTGGTSYTIDNYTTGATITTNTHPIAPPGPP
jgi:phage gp45-like